jgi:protein gp37
MRDSGPRWTGKVELIESQLELPLHWRKTRRIFVNSMSDLFHESVSNEAIDRVFAVMALCSQHTFQVLTKRPERMLKWFTQHTEWSVPVAGTCVEIDREFEYWMSSHQPFDSPQPWPLRNVHLGVSCENQETANARIPLLLQTPAAVRFVSLEPLLGPIDLTQCGASGMDLQSDELNCEREVDQVIVGGESGPGARPMHPDWVRSIREQCVAAAVPFFFKQWGEWAPNQPMIDKLHPQYGKVQQVAVELNPNRPLSRFPCAKYERVTRVGKKAAGRVLDGRTWEEHPQ